MNIEVVFRNIFGQFSASCKRLAIKIAKANQVEDKPLAWYPQDTADSLESIKMNAHESRLRVLMKKKYNRVRLDIDSLDSRLPRKKSAAIATKPITTNGEM